MAVMLVLRGGHQMLLVSESLKNYYKCGLASTQVWNIPVCSRYLRVRYRVQLLYLSRNPLVNPMGIDADNVEAQAPLCRPVLSSPDTITKQSAGHPEEGQQHFPFTGEIVKRRAIKNPARKSQLHE